MTKQLSKYALILILSVFSMQLFAAKKDDPQVLMLISQIDTLQIQLEEFAKELVTYDTAFQVLEKAISMKPDSSFVIFEMKIVEETNNQTMGIITSQQSRLSKKLINLQNKVMKTDKSLIENIDLQSIRLAQIEQSLKMLVDSLGYEITGLSDSLEHAKINTVEEFHEINNNIELRTVYWIVASLVLAILIISVFLILRYKVADQRKVFGKEIDKTRHDLQEQTLKIDSDLLRLFESKITIEKETRGSSESSNHGLPLKLADEIHKMRKRLVSMDENHHVKVLNKRIESLEDTIIEMGYKIVPLEGTQFDEGMRVEARFIPDDDLEKDEQIITRVIKPQVNYKDKMIQSAQVEVSQGS